jgi:hypothetical protein
VLVPVGSAYDDLEEATAGEEGPRPGPDDEGRVLVQDVHGEDGLHTLQRGTGAGPGHHRLLAPPPGRWVGLGHILHHRPAAAHGRKTGEGRRRSDGMYREKTKRIGKLCNGWQTSKGG